MEGYGFGCMWGIRVDDNTLLKMKWQHLYRIRYLGMIFTLTGFIAALLPIQFLYFWLILFILGLIIISIQKNRNKLRTISFFCLVLFAFSWILNESIPFLDLHFNIGAILFPIGIRLFLLSVPALIYGLIVFILSFFIHK